MPSINYHYCNINIHIGIGIGIMSKILACYLWFDDVSIIPYQVPQSGEPVLPMFHCPIRGHYGLTRGSVCQGQGRAKVDHAKTQNPHSAKMEFHWKKKRKEKKRKERGSIYGFQHVFWWLCVPCRFSRSTFPNHSNLYHLYYSCTSCVPVDLDLKKDFGQVPFFITKLYLIISIQGCD